MLPTLEAGQQLPGGELGEFLLVLADLVDIDLGESGLEWNWPTIGFPFPYLLRLAKRCAPAMSRGPALPLRG
jgi:hypothetical protein